jgi:hypothetical protein
MSRAPESRANPSHAGPLTPPGNHPRHCSSNLHCVAIPTLCGYCAGRPMSFLDTMPPTPVHPSRRPLERGQRHPRKGYDHLLHAHRGRRHDVRPAGTSSLSPPALCGHPRHCAAIPGTAASSPALWESRSTGRHHAHRCAAPGLPSAQPSNQCTDDDQYRSPALLPSKPPLDGHKARHDTRQRQDLPGQLSIPRHGAPFRHM